VHVRPALLDDAAAIRAIYNHEVEHTTATFDLVPRTLDDQRAWLAARSGAFAAIVAVSAPDDATPDGAEPVGTDEVIGFAALSPYRERAAYRTSVENSIYIRRDQHRRGVGRFLLHHLLDVASDSGFHAVFARIEAGSAASRRLHEVCGFQLVGVEREVGRKFGRWLDVALMECVLHERSGGTVGPATGTGSR
jgi:phosphinothricin acetyltransferase